MTINMEKLTKLLKEDREFSENLKASQKPEDFIDLVNEKGIKFTIEDIEIPEEFSDYDLDNLTGGCCGCSGIIFDDIVERYRLKEITHHWEDIKALMLRNI